MRRNLLFALPIIGFASVVQAQDAADQSAVQAMIAAQLEAFQKDDGAAAFSHAAPIIKQQFAAKPPSWIW